MQKSKVVYFKSADYFSFLKEGYPFFIMYLAYIIGMILGVSFYKSKAISPQIISNFLITDIAGLSFAEVFFNFLLKWAPIAALIWLFGMCSVGSAIIPLLICTKGIEYGMLAGYICSSFSVNGIVYLLILIIPSSLLSIFSLFFAGKNSFIFSIKIFKILLPQSHSEYLHSHFVIFCKRMLLYLLILIIAAFLHTVLATAFAGTIKLI